MKSFSIFLVFLTFFSIAQGQELPQSPLLLDVEELTLADIDTDNVILDYYLSNLKKETNPELEIRIVSTGVVNLESLQKLQKEGLLRTSEKPNETTGKIQKFVVVNLEALRKHPNRAQKEKEIATFLASIRGSQRVYRAFVDLTKDALQGQSIVTELHKNQNWSGKVPVQNLLSSFAMTNTFLRGAHNGFDCNIGAFLSLARENRSSLPFDRVDKPLMTGDVAIWWPTKNPSAYVGSERRRQRSETGNPDHIAVFLGVDRKNPKKLLFLTKNGASAFASTFGFFLIMDFETLKQIYPDSALITFERPNFK